MIPQDTIAKIFDTSDIVEVISDFVNLKKSGANFKGLSPFSNEKTPSFTVSPAKGIYKCSKILVLEREAMSLLF